MTAQFVLNFFGFLLQTVPCVLLFLLPFQEEAFVYSRKKTTFLSLTVFTVGAAAIVLIQIWISRLNIDPSAFLLKNMAANFILAGSLILWIFLCFRQIQENLWKKILVLFLVLDYAVFLFTSVNSIYVSIADTGAESVSSVYAPETFALYLLLTAATYPFLRLFMKNRLAISLKEIGNRELKHALFFVSLITVAYTVMLFILCFLSSSVRYQISGYLICTHLLCSICLAESIWFLLWEIQRTMYESRYKILLQLQQMQYQKISDDLSRFHRFQHDMRHHFRTISTLLLEEKKDAAESYIAGCVQLINSSETERFCKDLTVNALLQYYIGEARAQGIQCEVHVVLDRCPIDAADMTVILGNCLENAVAACLRSKNAPRIHLNIRMVHSTLAIFMENTCDSILPSRARTYKEGTYVPAKAISSMSTKGGQGLSSIEYTAEKYNGTAEFCFQYPLFTSRITLDASA